LFSTKITEINVVQTIWGSYMLRRMTAGRLEAPPAIFSLSKFLWDQRSFWCEGKYIFTCQNFAEHRACFRCPWHIGRASISIDCRRCAWAQLLQRAALPFFRQSRTRGAFGSCKSRCFVDSWGLGRGAAIRMNMFIRTRYWEAPKTWLLFCRQVPTSLRPPTLLSGSPATTCENATDFFVSKNVSTFYCRDQQTGSKSRVALFTRAGRERQQTCNALLCHARTRE